MENRKWVQTYPFIWSGQFIPILTSYAVHFAISIFYRLQFSSLPSVVGLLFTGTIAEQIGSSNSLLISGHSNSNWNGIIFNT